MDASDVIAVVAVTFAFVGLIASLFSLKAANRGLRVTANQNAVALMLEADRMILEHPELWPYFHESDPENPRIKNANENRVGAAAELYLDVMESIWDHHAEYTDDDENSWREWIHYVFEVSEPVQETYDPVWYPSLTKMIKDGVCREPEEHRWDFDKLADWSINTARASVSRSLQELSVAPEGETPKGLLARQKRLWSLVMLAAETDLRVPNHDRAILLASAACDIAPEVLPKEDVRAGQDRATKVIADAALVVEPRHLDAAKSNGAGLSLEETMAAARAYEVTPVPRIRGRVGFFERRKSTKSA